MHHIVLLGDSIFDNRAYVPDGASVIERLRGVIPKDWQATLLAVDGAIASDVSWQLKNLPVDGSHVIVSVGGNDALMSSSVLREVDLSAPEGFAALAAVRHEFQQNYRSMLKAVCAYRLPVFLCTIYDQVPQLTSEEQMGLGVFNEIILREAVTHRLPVFDLRVVCDHPEDYSDISPIEPSEIGGGKIARVIFQAVNSHDFSLRQTVIHTGV